MHNPLTDTYLKALTTEWSSLDFDHTDQAEGLPCPPTMLPCDPALPRVTLLHPSDFPAPVISAMDALLGRTSTRKYTDQPLTLAELSCLLYATQGVRTAKPKFTIRTVPSAGARHAFETWLVIRRVEGIEPGLYRYLALDHTLARLGPCEGPWRASFAEAIMRQDFNHAVYFLWTAVPYRMEWRYAHASAKLLALDAGHICQNLYLACGLLGLGTCAIGAYQQEAIDRLLGLDGVTQFVIYAAPVGRPAAGGE